MKPPKDPFLTKLSPAIIAPHVGQWLENVGRELGALANKDNSILLRNNNMFNLSPMGSFCPYGRNTQEILPFPHLPHCHPFFSLHFFLNLPETQVPISLWDIYIFHSTGIWFCEPSQVFQGESKFIECSSALAGLCPTSSTEGTACPLGPLSCPLGTHGSLGPVPMGRSNEGIKPIDKGQPSLCLPACRVAGQPHICLRKKMSVYY